MIENTALPYKLLPLKDVFGDYPGGAKAFLQEHGDYVNKPKDCYVAVVEQDFTNLTTKTVDTDSIFGAEITLPNDDANLSAVYFKKDLNLPNGGFIDFEMDWSPSLIVEGNLLARVMNLSGGNTLIKGNCTVTEVLYGFYNHGELIVEGVVNCPLIIADDYSMQLKGNVNASYIIGTAWKTLAPFSKVPVWDVSDDAKKIKAVMDSFFYDRQCFDGGNINIALDVGDCILKDKPASAKNRNKADYYQLSDNVKNIVNDLLAQQANNLTVTNLALGGYHMGEFPDVFKQFNMATSIDLHNNSIKKLPTWLANFNQLQHLNICTNDVKKLPLSAQQLANLQSLDITDTLITNIGDTELMPNLTELCFAKKDYGNDGDDLGRMAIDFNYARTPNLRHLHISDTGWFWPWDSDFGFYQCNQLKYLQLGYSPRGKMGQQLRQLQQLEFYGFETDWQFEGDDNDDANCELNIDVLASLPNLQMLHITKDTGGITKETIAAIRSKLPNLYICAPYAKFGFEHDDMFEKLNEQFDKVQNYKTYEPKNEALVKDMLALVQQHRLNISPKWFEKTWAHILMHHEGKARDCNDLAQKIILIKNLVDVAQLLKPYLIKTASWTHLLNYSYDLWELVYSAEVWYALRRVDANIDTINWALTQLETIYLPIEQKQGHRREFAGLYHLALELKQELQ